MSRKKKHAEHVNHERWMVSYADFVTLLFAFFVVMFASSQVDKRKAGKIALAVQVAFQELGLFTASNAHMPLSMTEPMPSSQVQVIENVFHSEDLARVVESPSGTASAGRGGRGIASDLRKELERALAPEIQQNSISLRPSKEGFVISLREVGFFDSGSADLKPTAEPAVETIARLLKPRGLAIRIEGHTDNIPIHNGKFKSNWDLSTARATALVALFGGTFGYDPALLAVSGYAEYHPVASNSTAEGRAMNRRVDIVILAPETAPYPMESKPGSSSPQLSTGAATPGVPTGPSPVASASSSGGGHL